MGRLFVKFFVMAQVAGVLLFLLGQRWATQPPHNNNLLNDKFSFHRHHHNNNNSSSNQLLLETKGREGEKFHSKQAMSHDKSGDVSAGLVIPSISATTSQIQNSTTIAAWKQQQVPVFHMNLYLFKEARKYIKHFEVDGLKHSKFLRLSTDPFAARYNASVAPVVWMGSLWTSMPRVCEQFANLIARMQKFRQQHGLFTATTINNNDNNNNNKWPIHILDWSDETTLLRCEQVEHVMGKEYVYYHKRSMVMGRRWNATSQSMHFGRLQTFDDWNTYSAAPVHHISIPVRSDFVQAIESYARHQLQLKFHSEVELTDALVHLHRPFDVVHFWPGPNEFVGDKVDNRKRAQWRNAVSKTLQDELRHHPTNRKILAFAGLKGQAKDQGREHVQIEYLQEMLQYKIVVVAQKDEWEDHYRLFEALLSGALVMSDVMLSLPSGLHDDCLVFYRDLDELKEKILYYIQHDQERRRLAKRGRYVALTRHRSWHWMERAIFGQVKTFSSVP